MVRYPDIYIGDDFPAGRPQQEGGPHKPLSEWGMLARGKTLGKSAIINFDTVALLSQQQKNAQVNLLEVQGDDEYGMPLCLTLLPPKTLFPVPATIVNEQNLSGTRDNIDAFDSTAFTAGIVQQAFTNVGCQVEWGIGGASCQVEADVLNGLCLNLSASWVRVRAFADVLAGQAGNNVYQLSAFLGPGNPKPTNAQRTLLLRNSAGVQGGLVANGAESAPIPIPRFAKRVYVYGIATTAVPAVPPILPITFVGSVRFWRDDLGATFSLLSNGETLITANVHEPSVIPNGSYYFTVINNSGQSAQIVAVFELAV